MRFLDRFRRRQPRRYPGGGLVLKGHYRFQVHDADGHLIHDAERDNVVEINGKCYIALWLGAQLGANPTVYGSIGTTTATYTGTETTQPSEYARVALAATSRASNILVWSFFWTTAQSGASLQTAAVWLGGTTALGSGNLFSLVPFVYSWPANTTLTIQFTLTVG